MNREKILGLLGIATRARKIVFGTDAVLMNIKNVKMIFVANDASEKTISMIRNKCEYYKTDCVEALTSFELSQATGKTNLNVIGINDIGFKENLNKLLQEGVKNESN